MKMKHFLMLMATPFALLAPDAFAATAGAAALPWDAPLAKLTTSVSGPVAYTIAIAAVVVGAGTLAFASDLSGLGRLMVYLTIVIAIVVLAAGFLTTMFGAGAVAESAGATGVMTWAIVALLAASALAAMELAVSRWLKRESRGVIPA